MADLIDRAALLADIDKAIVYSGRIGTNAEMRGANKIVDRIKAAPAVDAVEVVRCKDCQWWGANNDGFWFGCAFDVHHPDDIPEADDYCSKGERKET